MKKSNVYTRTGDTGTTSLVGGTRVAKTDLRLEAYGTVDELNSCIGMLREMMTDDAGRAFLLRVQHRLFVLGGYLATDRAVAGIHPSCVLGSSAVAELETEIDRIDAALPQLRAFVIPGGCGPSAFCNICRTVCRRMERAMLRLDETTPLDAVSLAFANRLSDYLFVLSRQLNAASENDEIYWDKGCV